MHVVPNGLDIWVLRHLTRMLGTYPSIDLLVQGAVLHNLLGGIWFAGAVFLLWLRPSTRRDEVRRRLITTFAGSLFAIALASMCARMVSALPPFSNPMFAGAYPGYMNPIENANSFPSDSTAVYASVTAGVTSISAGLGSFLWAAVLLAVALPRIYLGGHYPTDILAGLACGLTGYGLARWIESHFAEGMEARLRCKKLHIVVVCTLFLWIVELANEFREVVWAKSAVSSLATPGTLSIGGDPNFRQFFRGRIDEVRIYNRAITQSEIVSDMKSPISNSMLSAGLIAAYSFDEGRGSRVRDSSAALNEGMIKNAAWTKGVFNSALEFSGAASLVTIRGSDLELNTSISVEAWVYPTAPVRSWADVVYKKMDKFYLEAGSDRGVPAFGTRISGRRSLTLYAHAPLALNTWTHLAGTCDGATATLYVNGIPVAETK